MLVYFQIGPPSSLDLGGEQDMRGSARTSGEGLQDGMQVALAVFLHVTSETAVEVRDRWEPPGAVEVTLFVTSFQTTESHSFFLTWCLSSSRCHMGVCH